MNVEKLDVKYYYCEVSSEEKKSVNQNVSRKERFANSRPFFEILVVLLKTKSFLMRRTVYCMFITDATR